MVADLTVKGKPGLKFQRSFVPSYNYINAYAENVRGDMRALDPGIMSGNMGIEPEEIDFLLILSRQEMSRRLSSELRRYYDAQKDTTSIK